MNLTECLQQFFCYYLPKIKGVSHHTVAVYKQSFELLLLFAAAELKCPVNSLKLEHLSIELIIDFLEYLEKNRHNSARTRNLRLASLKSLAKMIRLLHPEYREYSNILLLIPQKRAQKKLIGFLHQEEILQILEKVDLTRKEGMRDYTILNLLLDSGIRASEAATLHIDYFDYQNKMLAILGKGNKFRQVSLWPKTADLLKRYLDKYRKIPKFGYGNSIFINQRGEQFTRHGINRICKKYLRLALPEKRLKVLNPVHSFRHSCAMNMLAAGAPITDIKNRLGHESINSTMVYLKMEMCQKREVQEKFLAHTQSVLSQDSKIGELNSWENKEEILTWLDSL
jgi:site-specific recombinase XerD